MQKMTKGAIAAAAAALLLVGGGGTFMSWNQDQTFDGSAISAGTLALNAERPGAWKLNGEDVADISLVRIVPGDTLVFTQGVQIDAEGDNIQGTLTLAPASITAGTPGEPVDDQLAAALNSETGATSFAIQSENAGLTEVVDNTGVYEFAGTGQYAANLIATLDFGSETVEGLAAQGGAVDLSDLKLSLTQIDPTPEATPEG